MTKEKALKVWEHEYGNALYAHDFSGRKVKRDDYEIINQVGWVVGYIVPLTLGGKDNLDNMLILNHVTAYEKADNYPCFEILGQKYQILHDDKEDFYYIEKIVD